MSLALEPPATPAVVPASLVAHAINTAAVKAGLTVLENLGPGPTDPVTDQAKINALSVKVHDAVVAAAAQELQPWQE